MKKVKNKIINVYHNYFKSKDQCNEKIINENILKINVSFFILIAITLVVILSDLTIFLFNLEYKISLFIGLIVVAFLSRIFIRKRKIKVENKFNKMDLVFWILFIILIVTTIVYPDSFWDTRSYHIYLQDNPFVDKINDDFFAGRTLNSFLFALADRIHYVFRYFLGYRLGTLMSYYLLVVLYYQVKKFLTCILENRISKNIISILSILPLTLYVVIEQTGTYYIDNFSVVFTLELFYIIFCENNVLRNRLNTYLMALIVGIIISIKVSNIALLVPLFVYFIVKNYKDLKYLKIYDYLVIIFLFIFPYLSYMLDNIIQTGSPVFPYYNNILKSEYFMEESWKDTRFGGKTIIEILLWPLYGIKYPNRLYDYGNVDVMWYAGYVILIVYILFNLVRKITNFVTNKINNKKVKKEAMAIFKGESSEVFSLAVVLLFTYLMWSKVLVGYIRYAGVIAVLTYILVITIVVKSFSKKKYILCGLFSLVIIANLVFTVKQYRVYKNSLINSVLTSGKNGLTLYINNLKEVFYDKDYEKISIDGVWGVIMDDSSNPTLLREENTPIYNLRKSMTSTNELTTDMYYEKINNNRIYVPLNYALMESKVSELSEYGFRITSNINTYFNIAHLDLGDVLYVTEVEYTGEKTNNTFFSIDPVNNSYEINIEKENPKMLEFDIATHHSLYGVENYGATLDIVYTDGKIEKVIDSVYVEDFQFNSITIDLTEYKLNENSKILFKINENSNPDVSKFTCLNPVINY